MDLLEFRALAKLRDGRQGERPTSSLSEFTEDETRFVRALVAAGRADDVRNHFAGASLAVAFARDAFAPALAGALIRKSERREPTAEDAPDARGVLERRTDRFRRSRSRPSRTRRLGVRVLASPLLRCAPWTRRGNSARSP